MGFQVTEEEESNSVHFDAVMDVLEDINEGSARNEVGRGVD